MTDQPDGQRWLPKVGEPVRRIAESTISGRLCNVRGARVTKVTAAGYVYIDIPGSAKHRASTRHPHRYYEWHARGYGGTIRTWIEPIGEADYATLPRDSMGGSRLAQKISSEVRQADLVTA